MTAAQHASSWLLATRERETFAKAGHPVLGFFLARFNRGTLREVGFYSELHPTMVERGDAFVLLASARGRSFQEAKDRFDRWYLRQDSKAFLLGALRAGRDWKPPVV